MRDAMDLSSSEAVAYCSFAAKAPEILTEEQFAHWCVDDLLPFFPFGILVCAVGRMFGDMVVLDELQGVSCPPGLVEGVARNLRLAERHVIRRWLETRQPQYVRSEDTHVLSTVERDEFNRFSLGQIAAHGLIAPDGQQASYFSFSQLRAPMNSLLDKKLKMVVPMLHHVRSQISWQRLQSSGGTHAASRLTQRELEILRWLMRGKSNRQIAELLCRSPQTVKHQVASVLAKLGATNRAQACVRALEIGILIEF